MKTFNRTKRYGYVFCSDCGYGFKNNKIFIKSYQNTAFCLCNNCAKKLLEEITEFLNEKEN